MCNIQYYFVDKIMIRNKKEEFVINFRDSGYGNLLIFLISYSTWSCTYTKSLQCKCRKEREG